MPIIGRQTRPITAAARPTIVAAGRQIEAPERRDFRTDPDSDELWSLYRQSGELRFVVQFKANAASRLTYFVGAQPDETQDPDPDLAIPEAREAFERVQGELGDFSDFAAELVQHLEVVGEGFFVGDDEHGFDVYSSDEYRKAKEDGYVPQADQVPRVTDDTMAVRVWRPDPQDRRLADSPVRGVRIAAETLILLSNMTQALTRSRLPAKILAIPDELSLPNQSNTGEDDPESDPFIDSIINSIIESVKDDRSAVRVAPIIIRGQGEYIDKIKTFDLTREMPDWIDKLVDQNIKRLAAGMDAPAEILTGMAGVNHWTAWQIEESAYKQHVDPLVMLILDSLTRGYLWSYLREANVPEAVIRTQRFWRDYSDLTARTASVEAATEVYDRNELSGEALRMYTGFNEADAPNDEERAQREERRLDRRGLPAGPEGERQPPLVAAASPGLGDIDRRLYIAISEASQAALDRALEKASNRVRSSVRGGGGGTGRPPKHPTYAQAIDGLTGRDITLTLGKGVVTETLQLSDDDLIPEGTFDALAARVASLLERGQRQVRDTVSNLLGTKVELSPDAPGWVEKATGFLTAALTGLALKRLFTPDTRPNPADTGEIGDTNVPAGDVFDALTLASGGTPSTDPQQPRGLAGGQQTIDWVEEAGATIGLWLWQHGSPAEPFEPHLNLNGTLFDKWTDTVLATPSSASWLHTPYMFPGDHRGCSCVAVPQIEPPEANLTETAVD